VAGHGPKEKRVPNDAYPTPPLVTRALLAREKFLQPIWEPACGAGHMVRELQAAGYEVFSSDIVQHDPPHAIANFLTCRTLAGGAPSIITNPPFVLAEQFIRHAIELGAEKHAWLLRIQFIEGAGRYCRLFSRHPPARIHVFVRRMNVTEQGLENPYRGLICFSWWVWERGFAGRPELHWINDDPPMLIPRSDRPERS